MTSAHDEQPAGTFGDAAGEMPNETEVEAPLQPEGASAPAGPAGQPGQPDAVDAAEHISGVSDWIEEGGPLEPSDSDVDDASAQSDELVVAAMALEERTRDLQRLQAEFLNYKRRVERDRDLIKQNATYAALAPITEVLDTIDRAREHGELESGLRTVADQLERTVASSGLIKFGAPGEAFDPNVHEALSSTGPDPELTVSTVRVVVKSGYKIGDRVVRAAQVITAEPDADAG